MHWLCYTVKKKSINPKSPQFPYQRNCCYINDDSDRVQLEQMYNEKINKRRENRQSEG